jgi:ArsR family transcriptional regulator
MVSSDIKTKPGSHRGGRRLGSGKRAGSEGPPGLRLVQAIADPSRWAILELIAGEPMSVGAIARRIDRSVGCTSRHISILREDGLVAVQRAGKALSCSWPQRGTAERAVLDAAFAVTRVEAPPAAEPLPIVRPAPDERPLDSGIPEFETYRTVPRKSVRPGSEIDDYLL